MIMIDSCRTVHVPYKQVPYKWTLLYKEKWAGTATAFTGLKGLLMGNSVSILT